ncbi:MAG TPA: hemin uptake protein HemP [Vineibacter sp.]|nr:hemin uptake protein HemP [Vineibacter sp.]
MHTGDQPSGFSMAGQAMCDEPVDGPARNHGTQRTGRSLGPTRAPHLSRPSPAPAIRRVGSRELVGASGQLIIRHGNDDYRLRVTSKGKLILTK